MSAPFEAKYHGECENCEQHIRIGDLIHYTEQDIITHADCTPPKPAEVCTTCWLTKPCDCQD